MKIEFNNYYDDCDEFPRKFSIDWAYYNSRPETLIVHNKYRRRIGMFIIKDDGAWAYFRVYFGKRCFEIHLTIRKREYENG